MGRNFLTVDGVNLSTYGVYISGSGTFGSPEKEYTYFEIPAKNGSDLGASSRLKNISVTYPAFIYANFKQNLRNLRSFLLSREGYVRISDTYHPDEFRIGTFEEAIAPEVTKKNDAGEFDIVFNCKPQRFLLSGEEVITLTSSGSYVSRRIDNDTMFLAKPLLRAYGTGNFGIYASDRTHSVQIGIASYSADYPDIEYIDIDCETMNCYNGETNMSKYITFMRYGGGGYGVDAPCLIPGQNTAYISTTANITKLEITPRFWVV